MNSQHWMRPSVNSACLLVRTSDLLLFLGSGCADRSLARLVRLPQAAPSFTLLEIQDPSAEEGTAVFFTLSARKA